jgi:hypothetical protein
MEVVAARAGAVAVEVHADGPAAGAAWAAARLVRERREVGFLEGRGGHERRLEHGTVGVCAPLVARARIQLRSLRASK